MYEYKVIPAPNKGQKARGVKTHEARFANALQIAMNELAKDGWEYQRTDMLPSEERQGLKSTQTVYRSVMVFRRAIVTEVELPPEPVMTAPVPVAPAPVARTGGAFQDFSEPAPGDQDDDAGEIRT